MNLNCELLSKTFKRSMVSLVQCSDVLSENSMLSISGLAIACAVFIRSGLQFRFTSVLEYSQVSLQPVVFAVLSQEWSEHVSNPHVAPFQQITISSRLCKVTKIDILTT